MPQTPSMPERHKKLHQIVDALSVLREENARNPQVFLKQSIRLLESALNQHRRANYAAEREDFRMLYKLVSNGDRKNVPESVIFWLEDKLREDSQDDQLFE